MEKKLTLKETHMEGKKAQKMGNVLFWLGVAGLLIVDYVIIPNNPQMSGSQILELVAIFCACAGIRLNINGMIYSNGERIDALEEETGEEISMLKNRLSEMKREMVELENEIKAHRAE